MTPVPDLTSLPEATPAPRTGRGRKPGSKVKERAELPPDAFVIEAVPVEDRGTVRRKRVERKEQQRAIDAKVLDVWKEWRDSGRPTDWLLMPVKFWRIEKKFAEDAKFFLGKAATMHGKKLVLGEDQKVPGSSPPVIRIPFCVIDRPVKVKNEPTIPESPE